MKRKLPFILLFLVFVAAAVFAGYKVITILADYKAGEDTYEDLQQYIHIDTTGHEKEDTSPVSSPEKETDDTVDAEEQKPQLIWPEVDFQSLQAINDDVVAWIYIEGTQINYPIVKGKNNDYYLRRMINGNYNNAGSIFMDYRNHSGFGDSHTIIYGHHMDNGTMFSDILNYKDQAYFDEHPICQIMTPGGNYTLSFFTGYVAKVSDPSWQIDFSSGSDYYNWINDSAKRSYFASDIVPTSSDYIVTLSTCSYEFNNARFVLAGVLEPAM